MIFPLYRVDRGTSRPWFEERTYHPSALVDPITPHLAWCPWSFPASSSGATRYIQATTPARFLRGAEPGASSQGSQGWLKNRPCLKKSTRFSWCCSAHSWQLKSIVVFRFKCRLIQMGVLRYSAYSGSPTVLPLSPMIIRTHVNSNHAKCQSYVNPLRFEFCGESQLWVAHPSPKNELSSL